MPSQPGGVYVGLDGGGGVVACSTTGAELPPPHDDNPSITRRINNTSKKDLSDLFNMLTVSSKCKTRTTTLTIFYGVYIAI